MLSLQTIQQFVNLSAEIREVYHNEMFQYFPGSLTDTHSSAIHNSQKVETTPNHHL
jgi:hypothetical protein